MKKAWVATLLICLVPAVASATDTRIKAMGGKEKAWTVQDEVNIFAFPATLLLFPNTVYAEAGLTSSGAIPDAQGANIPYNAGFGAHVGLSENTVIAFYGSSLSRYLSDNLLERAFNGQGKWAGIDVKTGEEDRTGNQAIHNADHKGTFFFGQRFGFTRLGLAAGVWGDSYSVDEPDANKRDKGATLFDGALGLGLDFKNKNSIDMGLHFSFGNFADGRFAEGNVVTYFKSKPHWEVEFTGRGVFDIPGGEKIVPYINAGMSQGGIEWNQANGVTNDYSMFHFIAGADLRIQPLENVYVYPGIGVALGTSKISEAKGPASEDVQNDLLFTAPFVSASVDARVSSWFSFIFGARHSLLFANYEDTVNIWSESDTLTEFNFGAGLHFGNVTVDLMINPAWLMEELWTDQPVVYVTPVVVSGDDADDGTADPAADPAALAEEAYATAVVPETIYGDGFATQLAIKFTW